MEGTTPRDPPGVEETAYGFKKRLEFVAAALARRSTRRTNLHVLDVGCGTGNLLAAPLARMGYQVTGIDVHEESIRYAREQHRDIPTLTFDHRSIEDYPAESFDVVICSEVLEHVNDPKAFVCELKRLLRQGGTLVVTVPNGYGPFEVQSWIWRNLVESNRAYAAMRRVRARFRRNTSGAAFLNADSGHVNFFTRGALESLVADAGFRIEDFRARTIVCGVLFAPLFVVPGTTWANARFADRLPTWTVSGWMLVATVTR
ncbi:MAG: methyltransferase domain-containing protein [Polyangiaceae bacterium]|nr:methyltransferase domain-containing protein [Polyangiaceae bacterium]